MTLALLQALAIAAGGLTSLGSVLMVLLLLNSKSGLRAALAFATGYVGGYMAIGALSIQLGRSVVEASEGGPSPVGAVLMSVIGLVMLTAGIKRWVRPTKADAEPPSFMAKLDSISPARALGFGLLIPPINVKNLAIYLPAITVLVGARLTPVETVLALLLTTVVFCGAMLTPLLIYLLIPKRADAWLAAMRGWIEANSHKVVRVVLPIIGSLLLVEGGRRLWALFGPG